MYIGSSANPAGSTATVDSSSTATVTPRPAYTPRGENRADKVTIGSSSIPITGLCGPPLSAMPMPISTWALTTVAATTYSGRSLAAIRGRSTA